MNTRKPDTQASRTYEPTVLATACIRPVQLKPDRGPAWIQEGGRKLQP